MASRADWVERGGEMLEEDAETDDFDPGLHSVFVLPVDGPVLGDADGGFGLEAEFVADRWPENIIQDLGLPRDGGELGAGEASVATGVFLLVEQPLLLAAELVAEPPDLPEEWVSELADYMLASLELDGGLPPVLLGYLGCLDFIDEIFQPRIHHGSSPFPVR